VLVGVLAAALALGSVASLAGRSVTSSAPRPISRDPYVTAGVGHQTEVDPDAVAQGRTIVAAFQVGRGGQGALNTGWTTSTDGGNSWRSGFLPGITTASSPAGTYVRETDNSVAYDRVHHAWLISSLGMISASSSNPYGALLVNRSSNGITWDSPVVVDETNAPDKDWITCDNGPSSPRKGTCYALWSSDNHHDTIMASS